LGEERKTSDRVLLGTIAGAIELWERVVDRTILSEKGGAQYRFHFDYITFAHRYLIRIGSICITKRKVSSWAILKPFEGNG